MKAVQISKPGGNFELVERPIPQLGRGQVRIKVEACGICHSDALVKEGHFPGLQYPRVPGHEIAGRVDAVCSLKPARSVDIAAAQLLCRELGLAVDLFDVEEPFGAAPLDLEQRSRVVAAGSVETCLRLAEALSQR